MTGKGISYMNTARRLLPRFHIAEYKAGCSPKPKFRHDATNLVLSCALHRRIHFVLQSLERRIQEWWQSTWGKGRKRAGQNMEEVALNCTQAFGTAIW